MDTQNDFPTARVGGVRALAAPAGVAAGALAAAVVLHFRDPHRTGAYGFCPMYVATGLWCPACGGLRALNDLTNLDIGAAMSSNILIVPFVLVSAFAWIRWVGRRWRGSRARTLVLGPRVTVAVAAVLIAFTVTRNTPWGSWLAPA